LFALLAAGGNTTTVTNITDWLKTQVDAYADIDNADHYGPYSGSLAKLALVAEATGGNPHSFGTDNTNKDLLGVLKSDVCTSAQVDGYTCSAAGDFYQAYSGISQALGVLALQASSVASDHLTATSPVVARLHQLQCADGGFSSDLITAGQACKSDVDTTAYAVQALATIKGTDLWLGAAATYLEHAQHANGLFANPGAGSGENPNSTGLAAQALQTLVESAYAGTPAASGRISTVPTAAWQRAVNALVAMKRIGDGWPASVGGASADIRATTQALPAVALSTMHDLLGVPFAATARYAVPSLAVSRTPVKVRVTSKLHLTVTVTAPGAIVNGAKVTVKLGTKTLATGTLASGKATLALPKLPAGKRTLTVSYGGSANTSTVTKSYTVNVAKIASTLSVKYPKVVKTTTKAKFTVKVKAKGATVNKGKITVKLGTKTLAHGKVTAGKAVVKLSRLKKGKHHLKIKYSGTSTAAAKTKTITIKVK
jgi:hypothetical protein